MADFGKLWFEMGVRDNVTGVTNIALNKMKELKGEIKAVSVELANAYLNGKDFTQKGLFGDQSIRNAMDYQKSLYEVRKEMDKLFSLRRDTKALGLDSKGVDSAISALYQQYRRFQNLVASGDNDIDKGMLQAYRQQLAMTLTQVRDFYRVQTTENKAAEKAIRDNEKANKDLLTSLDKLKSKQYEVRNLMSKLQTGIKNAGVGVDTTDAANVLNRLWSKQMQIARLMNNGGIIPTNFFGADYKELIRQAKEIAKTLGIDVTNAQNVAKKSAEGLSEAYDKVAASGKRTNTVLDQMKSQMLSTFSLYAVENLLKSVIQIGGEFEVQHIALKSILGDIEQANTMFNEIKQLAVVSPFNFSQLISYSKQIAAFNIPYNEMYETTKRLADMSAGLGVDMGRLILAYGQVRSAAVLRGQELRQFTEAGIPMVQALADEFTRLNGRLVTTGEVFELISKRAVPFEMVKKILWDMTDEGGRFYNMQFTLSDTLAGKWSNLEDAWQIILSGFAKGESLGGRTLKMFVQLTTDLVESLDKIGPILGGLAMAGLGRFGQSLAASYLGTDIENNIRRAQKLHEIELRRRYLNMEITKEQYQQGLSINKNKHNYYVMLAQEGKMKESQIARAIHQKRINTERLKERVISGELTTREAAQLRLWRMKYAQASIFNIKMKEIGLSIKSMMGPFGWISLIIDGLVMAGTAWYLSSEKAADKMNEAIGNFANNARDRQREISDYLKGYNEKEPSSDEDYRNTIEMMKEQLKQYDSNYASIMREVDSIETLKGKYEKLKEELGYVKESYDLAGGSKANFEEIYDKTSKLDEAAKSWATTNDYLNRSLNTLAAEGSKEVESAIDRLAQKMPKLKEILYDDNGEHRKTNDILRDFADRMDNTEIQTLRNALTGKRSAGGHGAWDEYVSVFETLDKEDRKKFDEYLANAQKRTQKYDRSISGEIEKIVDATYTQVAAQLEIKADELRKKVEKEGNNLDQRTKTMLHNYFSQQMSAITNGNQSLMRWVDAQRWTLYFHYDIVTDYNEKSGGLQGLAASAWNRLNNGGGPVANPTGHKGFTEKEIKDAFGGSGSDVNNAKKVLSQRLHEQDNLVKALETSKDASDKQKEEAKSLLRSMESDWSQMFTDDWRNLDKQGNAKKGDKKDTQLEHLKNQVDLYKKFYSELQNAVKIHGQSGAMKFLKDNGFSAVFGWKNITDLTNYRQTLKELTRGFANSSEARDKFLNSVNADIVVQKRKEETDALKDYVSELQRMVGIMNENYQTYKKWMDLTGDAGLSAGMAGVAMNTTYSDYLRDEIDKALKASGRKESVDDIIGLDTSSAKKLGEETYLYDLWKKYRDEQKRIRQEDINELYEATKKLMTVDDEILAIEKQIAELRRKGATDNDPRILAKQKELAQKQMEQFENSEPYLRFYAGIMAMTTAEAEVTGAAIKENLVKQLADGTINADKYLKSIKNVDAQLQKMRGNKSNFALFAKGGISSILENRQQTAEGEVSNATIKVQKLSEAVIEAQKDIYRAEQEGNEKLLASAKERLALATRELSVAQSLQTEKKKQDSIIGETQKLEKLTATLDLISGGIDGVSQACQQLSDMFQALGQSETANGWSDASGYISAIGSPIKSATNALKSAMSGDVGGVISNTVGIITSPITALAQLHDKKLDRAIQKSQREVKVLSNEYNNLVSNIEKALGGIYTSGGYREMLANLKKQRTEIYSQMDNEYKKKDTDADKIEDYKQQLLEMDESIKRFAEDMAKTLYGIDIHSWASQLGDALFDAWKKGENGAEAFKEKAKDIIADVAKTIAVQKLIEKAMEPVLNVVTSEMDRTNGLLDSQSISRIAQQMAVIGNTLPGAFNNLMEGLDSGLQQAGLGSMKASSTSSSTASSIKSITEDTAGLLASYINAIRADVSVNRLTLTQILLTAQNLTEMPVIAQAQLEQLRIIASNTNRNANAADMIYDLLHKLAPDGTSIRVK